MGRHLDFWHCSMILHTGRSSGKSLQQEQRCPGRSPPALRNPKLGRANPWSIPIAVLTLFLCRRDVARKSWPPGKPEAGNLCRLELLWGCRFGRCAQVGIWEHAVASYTEHWASAEPGCSSDLGTLVIFGPREDHNKKLVMCERSSPGWFATVNKQK